MSIPAPTIRHDALSSLEHKRPNADGAALFWTLPDRRNLRLLRLLVAYETMADFLDSTSERGASAGLANGLQLHLAFTEAVSPEDKLSDYYRHHPWRDDGDYLRRLIMTCREACATLESYAQVRAPLVRAATLAQVQGIRHELDPTKRDTALEEWSRQLRPEEQRLSWFELASAASAWITVLALLALASKRLHSDRSGIEVYVAYFPWITLTATLLDSYADITEDAELGTSNYVAYYRDLDTAVRRAQQLVRRSTREAVALPDGHRHTVIVASMIALYLSNDSARSPELREATRTIARAGGPITLFLVPILRAWRIAYSQRSA